MARRRVGSNQYKTRAGTASGDDFYADLVTQLNIIPVEDRLRQATATYTAEEVRDEAQWRWDKEMPEEYRALRDAVRY